MVQLRFAIQHPLAAPLALMCMATSETTKLARPGHLMPRTAMLMVPPCPEHLLKAVLTDVAVLDRVGGDERGEAAGASRPKMRRTK